MEIVSVVLGRWAQVNWKRSRLWARRSVCSLPWWEAVGHVGANWRKLFRVVGNARFKGLMTEHDVARFWFWNVENESRYGEFSLELHAKQFLNLLATENEEGASCNLHAVLEQCNLFPQFSNHTTGTWLLLIHKSYSSKINYAFCCWAFGSQGSFVSDFSFWNAIIARKDSLCWVQRT